jgi:predicted enzyme related to lactoylglutathione lyase
MEYRYEVTVIPVSDVDAAKGFYAGTSGWNHGTWLVQEVKRD